MPLKFECFYRVELPFVLNLPDGDYVIPLDIGTIVLQIAQNQLAVPVNSSLETNYRFGSPEELATMFGEKLYTSYPFALRTNVKLNHSLFVEEDDLVKPTEAQVIEEYVRVLIVTKKFSNSGEALFQEAKNAVEKLSEPEKAAFLNLTSKRLTALKIFNPVEFRYFHRALNTLIRLYMINFKDQFVEEVAMLQLGSTMTTGIFRAIFCEGKQIDSVSELGKVPPMMKRPWLSHPQEKIEEFKNQLAAKFQPDPVDLLCVRSRSQLERGANRSAIIEASAALETAVARRIYAGFKAQGKTDAEIETCLENTKTKFSKRANQTLKDAIGKSIAQINNGLWKNALNHRDNYRNKIAHSDAEPPNAESEKVVNVFTALALLVKAA
jgi:hypothetical protein